MKTILRGALAVLACGLPGLASSAADSTAMWGCAPVGERRTILYLADQGAGSYIKFSGQRIAAAVTSTETEKRWTWGSNAMVLDADEFVRYYEGDQLMAQFKCKKMQ